MSNRAEHDAMVLLHQGLVRAIAWKIHRRLPDRVEIEDLIAYGQIGLLEAIAAFDSTRSRRFSTYAWHRIRGAILDGLGRMNWFVRAEFESGRYEPAEAGSGKSGAPPPATGTAAVRPASRQTLVRSNLDTATMHDRQPGGEERAMRLEVLACLRDLISTLPEKEAALLKATFYEGRTLTEAARRVGISTAWASRLQTRTLADLRIGLEHRGFQ